jgi:hypothetical protein
LPNTLCHIGIQLSLNRPVVGKNDLLWVIIACVLPDLPWIALKGLIALDLFDPYDLRLYCSAQASLFFCLFLSAGLACFARRIGRVFAVLGGNCLLHLLLDGLQIKWGNGVHLFSPFSWTMFHVDLAWPGHPVTLAFTVIGFAMLVFSWRTLAAVPLPIHRPPPRTALAGLFFLGFYLAGPVMSLDKLEEVNTYYLQTMRHQAERPGKAIEFDRVHYDAEQKTIKTFTGEHIAVTGNQPDRSGRVSLRGRFLTPTVVAAEVFHYHRDRRDLASSVGLFMACTLLLHSLLLSHFQTRKNLQGLP